MPLTTEQQPQNIFKIIEENKELIFDRVINQIRKDFPEGEPVWFEGSYFEGGIDESAILHTSILEYINNYLTLLLESPTKETFEKVATMIYEKIRPELEKENKRMREMLTYEVSLDEPLTDQPFGREYISTESGDIIPIEKEIESELERKNRYGEEPEDLDEQKLPTPKIKDKTKESEERGKLKEIPFLKEDEDEDEDKKKDEEDIKSIDQTLKEYIQSKKPITLSDKECPRCASQELIPIDVDPKVEKVLGEKYFYCPECEVFLTESELARIEPKQERKKAVSEPSFEPAEESASKETNMKRNVFDTPMVRNIKDTDTRTLMDIIEDPSQRINVTEQAILAEMKDELNREDIYILNKLLKNEINELLNDYSEQELMSKISEFIELYYSIKDRIPKKL